MERLTEKQNDKLFLVKQDNGEFIPCYWDEDNFRAIEKLNAYENLEEQGLFVRLPCKLGDVLYCIDNGIVETLIVNSFRIYNFNRVEIDFENASGFALCTFAGELDEGYFLSREEAEKKLEELKNGK